MISDDAAFFKTKVDVIYHQELTATIKRFQVFQTNVKDILKALLLENERLIDEVNRLNLLLENKRDDQ